jgi:hypothetical protein
VRGSDRRCRPIARRRSCGHLATGAERGRAEGLETCRPAWRRRALIGHLNGESRESTLAAVSPPAASAATRALVGGELRAPAVNNTLDNNSYRGHVQRVVCVSRRKWPLIRRAAWYGETWRPLLGLDRLIDEGVSVSVSSRQAGRCCIRYSCTHPVEPVQHAAQQDLQEWFSRVC